MPFCARRLRTLPIQVSLLLLCLLVVFFGCSDTKEEGEPTASGLAGVDGWVFADQGGKVAVATSATAPPGFIALSAADVTSPGSDAKTTTKSDGYFALANVPVRNAKLHVRSTDGRTDADVPVTLVSDVTVRLGQPTVTRDKAIEVVRAQLQKDHELERLLIMGSQNTFPEKVLVAPSMGNDEGARDDALAITLSGKQQWFFYIDLHFDEMFQHSVVYALVDAETGAVRMHTTATSPPLINGFSFYYRNTQVNVGSADLVSAPTKESREEPETSSTQGLSTDFDFDTMTRPQHHLVTPPCTDAKSYALLIGGGDETSMNNSVARMREMLITTQGVREADIVQFLSLHPGTIVSDIRAALAGIKAKLRPCDTLWFYIAAHGYIGGPVVDLYTKERTWPRYDDGETQTLNVSDIDVRDLKACHFYAIVDSCYSADWIKDTANPGRVQNGFKDQLEPKKGLDAVVVTASAIRRASHQVTGWNFDYPQTLFTTFLVEANTRATEAVRASKPEGRAPLDLTFNSMKRWLENAWTLPTISGSYPKRVLSARPEMWVRPHPFSESCDGVTILENEDAGALNDDAGIQPPPPTDAGTDDASIPDSGTPDANNPCAHANASMNIGGKQIYRVPVNIGCNGNQVCAAANKTCVGVPVLSPPTAACTAFHPGTTVTSDVNGWRQGVYCNGTAGGLACNGQVQCHDCPLCGTTGLGCNDPNSTLLSELYVECQ